MAYTKTIPQLGEQLAALSGTDVVALSADNLGAFAKKATLSQLAVYFGAPSSGGALTFVSLAEAEAATVPDPAPPITLLGYYAAADGGGGEYVTSATEPSHDGKFQTASGQWYELETLYPNFRQFGAVGDGSDATTAILSCRAYAASRSQKYFYDNGGSYRISQTLSLNVTGLQFIGAGIRKTVLIPTHTGPAFTFGQSGSDGVEDATVMSCSVAYDVSWSPPAPGVIQPAVRILRQTDGLLRDVEFYTCYDGIHYGSTSFPSSTPGSFQFENISVGCQRHGFVADGGAGIGMLGTVGFNGVPGNSGVAIYIRGDLDGFFPTANVHFEGFDTGCLIANAAGSVANINLDCNIGPCTGNMVEIHPTGTGAVQLIRVRGNFAATVGTPNAGNGVFIQNGGSGLLRSIFIDGAEFSDVGKEIVKVASGTVVKKLTIQGVESVRGGAMANNTYAAIDLGGGAHVDVVITGGLFAGDSEAGVYHAYGLTNSQSVVRLVVNGTDFSDAVSGVVNTPGIRSKLRKFANLPGLREPLTGVIECGTLSNITASVDSPLYVGTVTVGGAFGDPLTNYLVWRAPVDCRLTWGEIITSANVTTGAATATVRKNNVNTAQTLVISSGSSSTYTVFGDADVTLAAGDQVGLRLSTDGTFAPTTLEAIGRLGWEQTSVA